MANCTVRVDTSPIEKGEEVKQLKARHRRRMEKEAAATPEYKEYWAIAGARWAGKRGTRKPDALAHTGSALPQEYVGSIDGGEYFPGVEVRTDRAGHDQCHLPLPVIVPLQGVGLGVHNEGVGHFQVSSGMGGASGARYVRTPDQGDGRGMGEVEKIHAGGSDRRGKSDLHGGAQSREPRRGALDLAMFALEVEKAEKLALELCGKPGGKKAHRSAKNMRRAYELRAIEHKSGGVMHRLNDFQTARGGRRSNEPKTEAVRVRARI